jgi:hypothetical protein
MQEQNEIDLNRNKIKGMETESRSKSETEGKLRKQYFLEIKQERK